MIELMIFFVTKYVFTMLELKIFTELWVIN